ncbi:hypothetical protein ISCGN_031793 [Ixodes scapularis]
MPDVLAFQESHDGVHLSGYVRFEVPVEAAVRGPRASKPVHTFVRRGIPTIQHEPVVDNVPHILLELLPRRKEQRRVFLLNVYSPPKDQSKAVARILAEVLRVAKDTPLLVVGDFNANHAEWGHLHTLPKAVSLQECVDEHDYTILNDFRYPTRIGNSVSKNTSPDLSMTRMIGEVSWTNTGVSLGSDHYVLEMLMPVEGISAPAKRKVLVTDWDAFRRNRDASAPTTIEDLCGWTDDLLSSAELVTVESDASSTSGTAADVVVDYARSVGLECSHAKSELLVKRGYHERIFQDDVQVLVNGNHISESDSVRVLGMHLRKDLSNADAVLRIGKTAKSTARLIRRIANKRGGVKEGDVCRIVHAFVVSRVLYTVPYMRLTTTDKKKLDSIIRQVYKLALGLPMATSTDRLMQLGIHNTVSELVEAHRSSQIFLLLPHGTTDIISGNGFRHALEVNDENSGAAMTQLIPAPSCNITIDSSPKKRQVSWLNGRTRGTSTSPPGATKEENLCDLFSGQAGSSATSSMRNRLSFIFVQFLLLPHGTTDIISGNGFRHALEVNDENSGAAMTQLIPAPSCNITIDSSPKKRQVSWLNGRTRGTSTSPPGATKEENLCDLFSGQAGSSATSSMRNRLSFIFVQDFQRLESLTCIAHIN